MNQYACAITGHRPTRFCFGYNEEDPLCQKLKECLLEQFRILHDEKFVRTFFVGGALGVDMWAGEQLLTLKAQTGYEDIKIIVVIPFIGYDSKWPDRSRHRLKKLIQNANDSIVISHSADVSSYKKRNYYMERYARLAMREFEWYQNLADEACAMPGTFAVFALGLEGERWAPLVTEYLDFCDDEHSSLQGKFLHALIRKFGFQPWTLGVLVRGALSMQWLEPAKEFRSLIANAESLDALLTVKRRFSAYLLPEENKDPKFRAIAWQSLLWAIWGKNSENGGSKVIKTAPKELKEKYQQVFA